MRFLTFSCQRRLPLLSNPAIADLFSAALARSRETMELFAWVAMPEHVHLLCRPLPSATLERTVRSLKMGVARRVLARWADLHAPILEKTRDATGRPRFWQKGGGFDRLVRDEAEFSREVRYIHRNPIERGLVARPQDWRWSSVRWWMGERDGEVQCDPPPGRRGGVSSWEGFV